VHNDHPAKGEDENDPGKCCFVHFIFLAKIRNSLDAFDPSTAFALQSLLRKESC
jgi:hypothetical protein